MKKLLAMLLSMVLCLTLCVPVLAQEGSAQPFSAAEADAYREAVHQRALENNTYQAQAVQGGYELYFADYTLRVDTERLSADTTIYAMVMDDVSTAMTCPGDARGIALNNSLSALLDAYPIENTALIGTPENAVLYMEGDLPGQAYVSYIIRNGQTVSDVYHLAYVMVNNGVQTRMAHYTIQNDAVVRIELQFASDTLTLEEAKAELDAFEDLRASTEYASYVSSNQEGEAQAFGRDDLLFSGLDYLDLTPELAIAVLGDDYAEDWLEDEDTFIHVMEWSAASITFLCDRNRALIKVDSMFIDDNMIEGPRGIFVGDDQQTVLDKFRFDIAQGDGDVMYIYGAEGELEYGMVEFISMGEAVARYAFEQGDTMIEMILSFENSTLSDIIIQTY